MIAKEAAIVIFVTNPNIRWRFYMREKGLDSDARMIHVRLDTNTHKLLKIRVAEESRTIQDFVAQLINESLNQKRNASKGK